MTGIPSLKNRPVRLQRGFVGNGRARAVVVRLADNCASHLLLSHGEQARESVFGDAVGVGIEVADDIAVGFRRRRQSKVFPRLHNQDDIALIVIVVLFP